MVVKRSQTEDDYYSFVIDGEGGVVAHPDTSFLTTVTNFKTLTRNVPKLDASGNAVTEDGNIVEVQEEFEIEPEYKQIIERVMSGESGSGQLTIGGQDYYVGYSSVPMKGDSDSWSVITLKNKEISEAAIDTALFNIVLTVIITALLALLIIFVLIRGFSKPIKAIATFARKIAEGDFNTRLTDVLKTQPKGELGLLYDSFKKLETEVTGIIIETDDVLQAVNSGDLTKRIETPFSGDFEKLKSSVNNITEVFVQMMTGIQFGTEEIRSTATAFEQGSDELAGSAENLMAATGIIKSKLTELSDAISANSADAEQARNSSDAATVTVHETNANMDDMNAAILAIEKESAQISKIMKIIDDIAFQTNILALNAAVEAARAGESGKGFSVVADEVRMLANKSATAAKETGILIENSNAKIHVGRQIVEKATENFVEVSAKIEEITVLLDKISHSASLQLSSIKEVAGSVETITETSTINSKTASKHFEETDKLLGVVNEISDMVNHFNINV
jgi:methyl-accepting chemotaxis protein